MAIKNKAKDRDHNGRIRRCYTGPNSVMSTPGWWTNLFMNRPQRRLNKRLCQQLQRGRIDPEEAVFPTGNRRPHVYYW
ncbi:hypothetical protein ACRYJU_11065 [Alloalcanivorax xenomutans]|uniref:hypothetical protein n=1 Tax=Alloalcanivorax xenomutans TaxID=1094342 RepID=UPI003D9BDF3E